MADGHSDTGGSDSLPAQPLDSLFLADDLFDSPYFYAPFSIFDTIVLGVVLSTSGAASPDFYIACLLTVVLSVICNDARGLLMVTILAPLAYGYFVFQQRRIFRSERLFAFAFFPS